MNKFFIVSLSLSSVLNFGCKKNEKEITSSEMMVSQKLVTALTTDSLKMLLQNACNVFTQMRNSNGMYQKTLFLDGTANTQPTSVAVIGMGLTSLCVANAMGWAPDAAIKVITTLKSLLGKTTGFTPIKNAAGFFPHYMDMNTGANIGAYGVNGSTSEYSTIDNAILMCGVLFCKKYFKDSTITHYADTLWESTNWPSVVADASTGKVYLQLNADGSGGTNNTVKPYNEYMLVCWLAMNKEQNTNGPAHLLWNNFYSNPANLPKSTYNGISVLAARPDDFIAEHVYQTPYFFCHYFTTNSDYKYWMYQARLADIAWWASTHKVQPYEYGISAGSTYSASGGYSVDAINDNPDTIVSPHTLAGYFPVYPQGKNDLLEMWKNNKGVFGLPNDTTKKVLWRYSPINTNWHTNIIQGVDFATFMLGLASLDENLSTTFFETNNNFFN